MDAIRAQIRNPLYAGIAGLVIGLIIGWFVIGWGIWPVEYEGAGPADMRFEEKVQYLRTAIEAYGGNQDVAKAASRYNALGEEAAAALQEVAQNPGELSAGLVSSFTLAVGGEAVSEQPAGTAAPGVTAAATEQAPAAVVTEAAEEEEEGGSFVRSLLPILCVITLVLAAALIAVYFLRSRSVASGVPTPAMEARQAARQAAWSDYTTEGSEPPMAQFMASFKLGDDLFDDSFSIDSPAGEFMGECGVGISETIGVGDPKKVTAFEVWMFDKNDIQTVTKVLMSAHAYNDDATRQRLAAKGEPVLVEPGTETVLETQTLQMVARIVDTGYGDGALPPESYFERFIVELAIWPKA